MPHITTDKKPLSEVDKTLKNFYIVASRPHYKTRASRVFGKFVLTRFIDDLGDDKQMDKNETEESRKQIRNRLEDMKILEVGERCGFADYFGMANYFEDLFFLNDVMNEFSKSGDGKISNDYDFIYLTYSLLPYKQRYYEVLQERWDNEYRGGKKSYWGTDSQAWDLRNRVDLMVATANLIRENPGDRLNILKTEGIDTPEKIQFFEKFQGRLEGLADLHNRDHFYLRQILEERLKVGGVFMDYRGESPNDIGNNIKLFDLHKYKKKLGGGIYTIKSKQTFKKIHTKS